MKGAKTQGLLALTELVVDQGYQGLAGIFFTSAIAFDLYRGPQASRQHHHPHDAFGIHAAIITAHMDLAGKTAGQLGQFGRCTCVQAQLIADGDGGLDHVRWVD